MNKSLGDRMKNQYEDRTRYLLPRRTFTIIRVDGKAFHTYCHGLNKPFDYQLMDHFEEAAAYCCENMQGAVMAFCQSDEVSFLLTDFAQTTTDAWFDGDLRKIVSVSASLMTAKFNDLRRNYKQLAIFDSRAWTIPDREEAKNYFIWRQNDATRNSILSVAQSLYSHKQLMNKGCAEMQEMIHNKGKNWNDYSVREKRGRVVIRQTFLNGIRIDSMVHDSGPSDVLRHRWESVDPPIFTQDRSFLEGIIPKMEN